MLNIINCSKKFKKKCVLNNISIKLEPGVYGLLGPNGAGKTTLMRCICGLYNTDGGSIEMDGKIGYLPQKFGAFKQLNVYEMMQYFATIKNIDKKEQDSEIKRCLSSVNLDKEAQTKIKNLSGGMFRRLGIAQVMLGSPEIMIFDEPTVGLDPEERIRFKNIINNIKKDKIILISTHIVSDLETICDKILIISEGQLLFCGTSSEISNLANNKVFLISNDNKEHINGNYIIQDSIEIDGKQYLKILSDENIIGDVQSPTVEDGYMCVLKQI